MALDGRFTSKPDIPVISGKMSANDPKRTIITIEVDLCLKRTNDMESMSKRAKDLRNKFGEIKTDVIRLNEQVTQALYTGKTEDAKRLRKALDAEKARMGDIDRQVDALVAEVDQLGRESRELDKTILSLATGALALTVTFSGPLIANATADLSLLKYAWFWFAASVIAFPVGQWSDHLSIAGLAPEKFWQYLSVLCSSIGFFGFVVGVICFLSFAFSTLPAI